MPFFLRCVRVIRISILLCVTLLIRIKVMYYSDMSQKPSLYTPEEIELDDFESSEKQLEDALMIWDDKIKFDLSSLNKKKQLQQVKEQCRHSIEAKTENIKRLEAKKFPVKQQIKRDQERISQLKEEISEIIAESEHLKFNKINLEKEVEEFRKELIKVNEIHLKAMEHYKRKLNVRLEMHDNDKLTLHFTDSKASVILTSAEDGVYKLIATEPELRCFKKLVEILEPTHDISGCLAHIRMLLRKKQKEDIKDDN